MGFIWHVIIIVYEFVYCEQGVQNGCIFLLPIGLQNYSNFPHILGGEIQVGELLDLEGIFQIGFLLKPENVGKVTRIVQSKYYMTVL